jgi:hypothetical protein
MGLAGLTHRLSWPMQASHVLSVPHCATAIKDNATTCQL